MKKIHIREKKTNTNFQQFQSLDIKIGEILEVEKIPKEKGFFILQLNIGYKKIEAVCQLNKNQDLKKLLAKRFVYW